MASLPEPLAALVAELNRLPGIGPRSAERLALHLIQADTAVARRLADVLVTSRDKIIECAQCGGLAEKSPCSICANPARDERTVCVVERAVDILNVEKSGAFRGHYHVLGGKISPINGVGPEELRVAQLEQRLADGAADEVIIALGTDVEGDATGHYLAKRLVKRGVKVTRIAHGLPAGSGLEFADELTLTQALDGRRELEAK
ncbi:MAG: recombination mediator RecR [Verrucomicrobiota bacterium]|nr:recombination mediator RecR [Verrucomicrobiota bacterium]MDP6250687.1 recombination mediator RecR [Verrucomicrobiota bacterium]MDP7176840.1 recombination mediator RecR [Verrucomicrobiota bacterium]MDP7290688.1 recombination mediator RecR [Verrucomicrobiota bacterium]MDP7440394.1 recombination mediator RecR [Verrucomicrobiota bacterium]